MRLLLVHACAHTCMRTNASGKSILFLAFAPALISWLVAFRHASASCNPSAVCAALKFFKTRATACEEKGQPDRCLASTHFCVCRHTHTDTHAHTHITDAPFLSRGGSVLEVGDFIKGKGVVSCDLTMEEVSFPCVCVRVRVRTCMCFPSSLQCL